MTWDPTAGLWLCTLETAQYGAKRRRLWPQTALVVIGLDPACRSTLTLSQSVPSDMDTTTNQSGLSMCTLAAARFGALRRRLLLRIRLARSYMAPIPVFHFSPTPLLWEPPEATRTDLRADPWSYTPGAVRRGAQRQKLRPWMERLQNTSGTACPLALTLLPRGHPETTSKDLKAVPCTCTPAPARRGARRRSSLPRTGLPQINSVTVCHLVGTPLLLELLEPGKVATREIQAAPCTSTHVAARHGVRRQSSMPQLARVAISSG
mmetsp:Transcript_35341/g.88355  ORF Transcript_35341/g.88355 Transcript_35341/m.88355 type:complete len:264 (+) Transcript_35341:1828-2619(+)